VPQAPATQSLGLEAIAQAAAQKALAYSPVWLPGRVTAFHPPETVMDAKGTPRDFGARVDVQIAQLLVREIPTEADLPPGATLRRNGDRLEAVGPYPDLLGLPVCYPGPRGFRIRAPLEVGESGAVVIPTRATIVWRAGVEDEDPVIGVGAPRLESAFFLPGIELGPAEDHEDWTNASLGPAAGTPGGISLDALTAALTLDGSTVRLGAGATAPLALLPELKIPIATRAAAYAALPGFAYAADIVAIKAAEAAFAASVAALVGSVKGRG